MKTPAYIFHKDELVKSYNEIKSLLGGIRVYYALKANADKNILKILSSIDADFEVASLGEFIQLMEIGIPTTKIICGLPFKPLSWLKRMYNSGCNYFVYDTISEFRKLMEHSPQANKILRIAITDILPNSIDYGMPYGEIIENLNENISEIKYLTNGISFHISNNISIEGFNRVIDRVEKILLLFQKENMLLNIGGGYRLTANKSFFDNLNMKISDLEKKYKVTIIAEPGNTIVNSSGCIHTTVIGVKKRDENNYDLYVDAGKPTGIKTDEKRIPGYIKQVTKHEYCNEINCRFIDITCMHQPHFSTKLTSKVYEGDVFEYGDMGAYTLCLRSDFHAWTYPDVYIL